MSRQKLIEYTLLLANPPTVRLRCGIAWALRNQPDAMFQDPMAAAVELVRWLFDDGPEPQTIWRPDLVKRDVEATAGTLPPERDHLEEPLCTWDGRIPRPPVREQTAPLREHIAHGPGWAMFSRCSSFVRWAQYNKENGRLVLCLAADRRRFKVYEYGSVPVEVWEGLRRSKSPGGVYNGLIRGEYPCKLRAEESRGEG